MATSSFLRSLYIQRNVIGALLMREIVTRYGRKNIGFAWLFLEPILAILVVALVWGVARKGSSGITVYEFMLTGYPLMMMWRAAASRCIGAVDANKGLFFHRNIRVFDVFITRILLEVAGSTLSFIILLVVFNYFNLVAVPVNMLYMLLAWGLMAWFSFGLGLVLGVITEFSEVAKRVWKVVSQLLLFGSGVFFFVDVLPKAVQEIVLVIPMVHGTEMLRHGFFGDRVKTHEDIFFMIIVNLVLTLLGLILVQRYSRGIEPS